MKNLIDIVLTETNNAKNAIDQLDFKVADQAFQKIENSLREGIIDILRIRIQNANMQNNKALIENLEARIKMFEQLGE